MKPHFNKQKAMLLIINNKPFKYEYDRKLVRLNKEILGSL